MKTTPLTSVEEVVSHLPMFPDAEILMEDQLIDYDKYKVGEIATLLTQDRHQAYTSLVEGIEQRAFVFAAYKGDKKDETYIYFTKIFFDHTKLKMFSVEHSHEAKNVPNYHSTYFDLNDKSEILENVVKPLYGKE